MPQKQKRQHEPIRVPDRWDGQARMLVIQLNRAFDEVYALIGDLEQKVKDLQPEEEEEET